MKTIQLTQGQIALVDDEDFEYLNQFRWYAYKRKNRNTWYACRSVFSRETRKGTVLSMHRVILNLDDTKVKIDHIDLNGLNNQRNNLRFATASQNAANRMAGKNSKSKYLGVYLHSQNGNWVATICKNKKDKYLGVFANEKDAATAYNKAATEIHGEFARLNKIV